MSDAGRSVEELMQENEALCRENGRLQQALRRVKSRLKEPVEIIRAIQAGEIDALVIQERGREEIYALQRYDAAYRALVEESLPYGVWLAELNGKLMYVSRQFLELLQTDLGDMQEKGQFHFLPAETQEAFAARWDGFRETGRPCNFEYTVLGNDGNQHSIWTHGILTQAPDGRSFWAGINLDVTDSVKIRDELRRKAQELQEVDRRKDEFIALLGHELRNPVGVIRYGVDLLQKNGAEEGPGGPVLEAIDNQVSHLARLMDDLLDISRISTGTIQLRKETVDLKQVVGSVVEAVRPTAEAKGHTLEVALTLTPVHLEADPVRVEQVLVNLLSNAIKYTPPGGHINLNLEMENREAIIRVQDNGIGIAPEMLQEIFNLFVQSDRISNNSHGGLGIGLTLVRKLVDLHGGKVAARSAGEGQGSEFIVRLPLAPTKVQQPVPSSAGQSGPSARALRVLVVDDSPDATKVLGMLLESYGNQVRAVHDGPSVLAAAREYRPDIVLLDIGLPGMDGYEVARQMRLDPTLQNVILAAVTGYGQRADRIRSQEAGFDHHLVKPVDIDAIQRILEQIK